MFQSLGADLRFALRQLRRNPGFVLSSVGILGLGIGATTAIFTVVNGVLLRPLPYPHPDRIVRIREVAADGHGMPVAGPNFRDLRDGSRSFASMAAVSGRLPVSVTGGREPVRTVARAVSDDFFRVMGVGPASGRAFAPGEQRRGAAPAVVVSHGFWQRALGGGPIRGSTLRFGGQVYSVVGVMPRGFEYPAGTELWIPSGLWAPGTSRTAHNWAVVGRLADGVSLAAARTDLSTIAHRLADGHGDDIDLVDVSATRLRNVLVGDVRTPLLVLLGSAAFLLLIAVANVGNLLLARLAARSRELAVRRALGAGRYRLVQQLVVETLVLGLGAGAMGVLLARVGTSGLLALAPTYLPRAGEIGIDGTVLAFALAVSVATAVGLGVAAGLAGPADLRGALAAGQRTLTGGGRGRVARDALVVGQTGLTLVLLAGAGLMARSLFRLLSVDTGFRTDHVLVMSVAASSPNDPASVRGFEDRLLARLRVLPGVESVGGINDFPLQNEGANGTFVLLDRPEEAGTADFRSLMRRPDRTGQAWWRVASEGWFRTMGIPLVRGRAFTDRDAPDDDVHVAVISQALARRRWPDEDPIGKLIEFGNMDGDLRPLRVVGVVGDVRALSMEREPPAIVYAYSRQRPGAAARFNVALHVRGDPRGYIAPARRALREVNPGVPPTFRTIGQVLADHTADRRFALLLLLAFGGAALALALAGTYAVVAFLTARRRSEIGVRIAFGASRADVVRLVVGRSAALTAAGIAVGVPAALGLSRLLSGLLYGVTSADPVAYVLAALVLGAAAVGASSVPAFRAARADPAATLRVE